MEVLLLAVLLGLIPAIIAQKKGYSFVAWWIYGSLLFIVALPWSLLMKSDLKNIEEQQLSEGMRKCPYCAEIIKKEAAVCRFCGRDILGSSNQKKNNYIPPNRVCPFCFKTVSNTEKCVECGKTLTIEAY